MKNLAIIGASYLQLPLINKAKEMGYTTHVFAWEAHDVGESAADYFYPISIVEKEAILKKCREIGICGICSISSDLAVITVNYVADALHLPGNSLESTLISTNKHAMRKAFAEHGDPSVSSFLVQSVSDAEKISIAYPVIVKPTDRSGSRGITKVYDENDLSAAIQLALDQSFERKALVEEYAEGQEYSVEHISYHGKHHFLALTLKYTTGEPHFIETGHMEPAPIEPEKLEEIKRVVEHALDTLMIENGASHSELKIDDKGKIRIIEIGARMGGDCIGSDLVRYSTGVDFVRAVIQTAIGESPDLTPVCMPQSVAVKFIMSEEDIAIFEEMKQTQPERILQIVDYHPENIGHTTDSSNRGGCYIYKV